MADRKGENDQVAVRRDDALRRALNTPPTPHKPIGKKRASPAKRTTGKGRVRAGKSRS